MKKIFLLLLAGAAVGFSLMGCKKKEPAMVNNLMATTGLVTENSFHWVAADIAAPGYKRLQPAGKGEPVLIRAQFTGNNEFSFVFSFTDKNGIQHETVVEGNVRCVKGGNGKNWLLTKATRGSRKTIYRNVITIDPMTVSDLSPYNASWRWEKISFPGIPADDFLLLINTTGYPAAATDLYGCISKSRVSKLYLRK